MGVVLFGRGVGAGSERPTPEGNRKHKTFQGDFPGKGGESAKKKKERRISYNGQDRSRRNILEANSISGWVCALPPCSGEKLNRLPNFRELIPWGVRTAARGSCIQDGGGHRKTFTIYVPIYQHIYIGF